MYRPGLLTSVALAAALLGAAVLAVAQVPTTAWADEGHGVRLSLPDGFVVRAVQAAPPVRAQYFVMNPAMAAGALAGIEPPDLLLRVYAAPKGAILADWLATSGLSAGALVRPVEVAGRNGLEVCAAQPVAPGCARFALRGTRVFQFTAATLPGEGMARDARLD